MFFNNYTKPGKGVNKRDPNLPRGKVFLEVFPRKLWDLIKLNLLYSLTSIPFFIVTMVIVGIISAPIIDSLATVFGNTELVYLDIMLRIILAFWFTVFLGQGPVTAGYTYIIREHSRENPCWLFSDFFERAKSNFKQGILLWIIDLAVLYLMVVAFMFYKQNGIFVFQYIILVIGVLYGMMHLYVYHMMITFDLPLKSILKNSFLMAIIKVPANLLILAVNIVIYAVVPIAVILLAKSFIVLLIMFVVELLILPPVTAFVNGFYVDPVLDKYINVENKKEKQEENK